MTDREWLEGLKENCAVGRILDRHDAYRMWHIASELLDRREAEEASPAPDDQVAKMEVDVIEKIVEIAQLRDTLADTIEVIEEVVNTLIVSGCNRSVCLAISTLSRQLGLLDVVCDYPEEETE